METERGSVLLGEIVVWDRVFKGFKFSDDRVKFIEVYVKDIDISRLLDVMIILRFIKFIYFFKDKFFSFKLDKVVIDFIYFSFT